MQWQHGGGTAARVEQFLDARCLRGPRLSVPASVLWAAFLDWSATEPPTQQRVSRQAFAQALQSGNGCRAFKSTAGQRCWEGVGLSARQTLKPEQQRAKTSPTVEQEKAAAIATVEEFLQLKNKHTSIAMDGFVDATGIAVPKTFAQLRIPAKILHYVSTPEITNFLDKIKILADMDSHGCANAILFGETSGGKTDGVKQWCAERGYRCIRIDCSTVSDILDFLGDLIVSAGPSGSVTTFQPSEYIRAMLDPDFAVILLDEVNRVQSPSANNFQMSVLDDTRGLFVRQAEFYLQIKNKLFVGTLNGPIKGSDSASYVGTQPLDEALISRFAFGQEVKYPRKAKIVKILTRAVPTLDANIAAAIGNVANELAKHGFHKPNLRELIGAARLIGIGETPYEAMRLTVGRVYPNDGVDSLFTTFVKALEGQGIIPQTRHTSAANMTVPDVCDSCGLIPRLCDCTKDTFNA